MKYKSLVIGTLLGMFALAPVYTSAKTRAEMDIPEAKNMITEERDVFGGVQRLYDTDNDGKTDLFEAFSPKSKYPSTIFFDRDGDGTFQDSEKYWDLDEDGSIMDQKQFEAWISQPYGEETIDLD